GDADQLMSQLKRFGSVTVLNGHTHQIVQKTEGNITYHTARSTAYPQPVAGVGNGPGPLKVDTDQLPGMLGVTTVTAPSAKAKMFALADSTLAGSGAAVASAAGSQVVIKDFMFTPTSLPVKAGSTVTWLNKDEEPHTVHSDTGLFHSAAMDTNDSFSFKFDEAGTYHFTCSIHPRMIGTIVVS
ncbi:MAG TPA: cupredoxin family copper-binding protein, partial [Steroidobacteraceae bacterium]